MSKPSKPKTNTTQITVAVLEDSEATMDGIRYQLEKPDMHICGIGDNLNDFLARLKSCKPMVAIVDLRVGNDREAGFKAIQKGQELSSETKFIVFTAYDELEFFEKALKLGVKAFLVKRSDELDIEGAVRIVAAGGSYFGEIWKDYLDRVNEPPPFVEAKRDKGTHSGGKLTSRELEILRLLDKRMDSKQIAQALSLSLYTVKAHTNNLRKKLEVNSTSEALRRARLWGLLDDNEPDDK